MADTSKIEWTDATWNHIVGCSVVSPGCTNCYAMRLAGTRMASHPTRAGLTTMSKAGPVWNGQVRFLDDKLTEPLRWKRSRMIFVGAHTDLFHDAIPDEWIDKTFAVMALASQHTFQVLTKRTKRMREWVDSRFTEGCRGAIEHRAHQIARDVGIVIPRGKTLASPKPFPHVWLGASVEDQTRADERIPDLLATPAAVRWLSAEPMLGPIDLASIGGNGGDGFNALDDGADDGVKAEPIIDWVVSGGESGPGARPLHPGWARRLRDQCRIAGVPFLHKQNGEYVSVSEVEGPGEHYTFPDGTTVRRVGKKAAGRKLDGETHDGYPEAAHV